MCSVVAFLLSLFQTFFPMQRHSCCSTVAHPLARYFPPIHSTPLHHHSTTLLRMARASIYLCRLGSTIETTRKCVKVCRKMTDLSSFRTLLLLLLCDTMSNFPIVITVRDHGPHIEEKRKHPSGLKRKVVALRQLPFGD